MKKLLLPLLLCASPMTALSAQDAPGEALDTTIEWNRRTAEHLLNRAGFGATPAEVDAAVARGLEATIDGLFLPPEEQVPLVAPERESNKDGMTTEAARRVRLAGGKDQAPPELLDDVRQERNAMRRTDRGQLGDYTAWWFDTMIAGEDPLRDRMTLFWHGYFTSSMQDVKSSYQMIRQNQLLRTGALGSFGDLLFAVAKDPAMLEYLDNDENKKGAPNENFAREVMELFTLGEGNYTEEDIKEAARAFTGWRSRKAEFASSKRRHDDGQKTVLGVTGNLDGEDVLAILLDDADCAPYVASRLIEYLEGVAPSPERKAHYGELLRACDYDIEVLLRELFHDPAFYREEIVGQRVAGPVDYLVGMARRLEVTPPRIWLTFGSELLGQELFFPPSVKGWDEGLDWITTASFMQRGNLAGILLGVVDVAEVLDDVDSEVFDELDGGGAMESMDATMEGAMSDGAADRPKDKRRSALSRLKKIGKRWNPPIDLAGELAAEGARTEERTVDLLADKLLAVELPSETRDFLVVEYRKLKQEDETGDARPRFGDRRRDEAVLRKLAHLILSLPEAQLN